ncbi:MAG: hypothetical protein ACUZ8N_17675 [Candidatus Scalindua sp.]
MTRANIKIDLRHVVLETVFSILEFIFFRIMIMKVYFIQLNSIANDIPLYLFIFET